MHFNNLLFSVMFVCAVSCADNVENTKWLFPEDHDTDGWRSALYPVDWTPDFRDAQGRFIHDFSYAGYHGGMADIPVSNRNFLDVTKEPYKADNTGKNDATKAIQSAINDVAGVGGIVYLPAGLYKVSSQNGVNNVLSITSDNTVIRGDGHDKTFLLNTSVNMRSKSIVNFSKKASWDTPVGEQVRLVSDLLFPTRTIPVENAGVFSSGDLVVIKSDITDEFRKEYNVGVHWNNLTKGPHLLRTIVSVNNIDGTVEIDVPTRGALRTKYNTRIFKVGEHLKECGVEYLAIANIQNPKSAGWGENDYTIEGTGAYEVHGSSIIHFNNAENCWVKKVYTFCPEGNEEFIHILSNGISVDNSRYITVKDCNIQRSQYEGGGGNGYLYTVSGCDNLFDNCVAEHGRHNFDIKSMTATGNVIHKCKSINPSLASDCHMHLSVANLFDCFTADGDFIDASFRPWGSEKARHMYSTSESVIWNARGLKAHPRENNLVVSLQYGNGYVIGTSGAVSSVRTTPVTGVLNNIEYNTSPEDWVEGQGLGTTLVPQSLYEDQLDRRKLRENR